MDYVISSGATASYSIKSGDELTVFKDGVSSSSVVHSGGYEYISSKGESYDDIVSSGAYVSGSSGSEITGAVVRYGGVLQAAGKLQGTIFAGGYVVSGTLESGAIIDARGGFIDGVRVASGGLISAYDGATLTSVSLVSGATLILQSSTFADELKDAGGGLIVNGGLSFDTGGATTLTGALSGSGYIYEGGPGTLIFGTNSAAFTGAIVIDKGTVDIKALNGIGTAAVEFETDSEAQTLKIEVADLPSSGATFGNTLDYFIQSGQRVDLAGVAYTSGAKAKLDGSALVVTDGGYSATFDLGDEAASAYVVASDGHGGTLIRPRANSTAHSLVQAAAAFDALSQALGTISSHDLQSTRLELSGASSPASLHQRV